MCLKGILSTKVPSLTKISIISFLLLSRGCGLSIQRYLYGSIYEIMWHLHSPLNGQIVMIIHLLLPYLNIFHLFSQRFIKTLLYSSFFLFQKPNMPNSHSRPNNQLSNPPTISPTYQTRRPTYLPKQPLSTTDQPIHLPKQTTTKHTNQTTILPTG